MRENKSMKQDADFKNVQCNLLCKLRLQCNLLCRLHKKTIYYTSDRQFETLIFYHHQ